jgi:lipoprotein-releasing system ATP-binding protein
LLHKEPALILQNISKQYQQGDDIVHILKNINLTICLGELVAIIGSSGSGKSTILNIAGLLSEATSGTVNICHASNNKKHIIRLRHIGFIYQNHNLLSNFSARENVALPKLIASSNQSHALNEADELLNLLGLENKRHNMPGELSGGEQQRVAIARSLINKPKLVLADEPTGNLDQINAQNVFDLFLRIAIAQNTAILLVTHNNSLVNKMHNIYELIDGILQIKSRD